MNTQSKSAQELVEGIIKGYTRASSVVVGVAPPAIYVPTILAAVNGSSIQVGMQNCHENDSGAFTGEVSVPMINDIGAHFAIIGHSERRHVFGETNERIAAKVKASVDSGLAVIVCVGERLAEREAGEHEELVREQIRSAVGKLSVEQMALVRIAYEPVWAIGTGLTATPEQAGAMHQVIRSLLLELYGADIAEKTPILYGGSVKAANAEALLSTKGIDGALVGGASLKSESFLAIINAAPQTENS